ncbi:hypothetical protein J0J27_23105, partial [Vibrio vulnificus]|uniref:hypothetical protein n=1 Tax=Vibrio vulnificus TaxID=672 RepID=UPI0019D4C3E4
MTATRFIDREALDALGLKKAVKKMLKRSGCKGLYKMCEQTYRCLTLEFLSSSYADEEESTVNFRLFNQDNCLYPEE